MLALVRISINNALNFTTWFLFISFLDEHMTCLEDLTLALVVGIIMRERDPMILDDTMHLCLSSWKEK